MQLTGRLRTALGIRAYICVWSSLDVFLSTKDVRSGATAPDSIDWAAWPPSHLHHDWLHLLKPWAPVKSYLSEVLFCQAFGHSTKKAANRVVNPERSRNRKNWCSLVSRCVSVTIHLDQLEMPPCASWWHFSSRWSGPMIALPACVIGTVVSVSILSGVCRTVGLPNNALLRCVPVIQWQAILHPFLPWLCWNDTLSQAIPRDLVLIGV